MTSTKSLALAVALFALPSISQAAEAMHENGGATYHAIRLETDLGRYRGQDTMSWDLDGWIGNDDDKLWLKSEGEIAGSKTEQAEVWALYSRNVSTFWDTQVGLRQDFKTSGAGKGHTYLVAGINGLAPYFFDTEAHIFLRDDGALSARLRQENEILLTNRLIVRPRLEVNLNSRADKVEGVGSGLTDASIGVQTRYELTRGFAPYIDLKYAKKLGQTADYARVRGEKPDATTLAVGIRWLF